MASTVAARVQAFDWLRGLAVLFMIQCHAMVLLLPELKDEKLFRTLVWLDGLVAPAFTFSAGFSLALVTVRSAGKPSRLPKTLRRIGEVLAVATLVNWVWFPLLSQPKWLLRLDILHCIGLSLLLLLPVLLLIAARPGVLRWVALGIAAIVFAVAPLLEHAPPVDWLLNTSTGSVFGLMPWAGYVFLGASAGATAGLGDFWALVRWVAMIGLVGAGIWAASPFFRDVYPPHNFWVTNPANCAQRWTLIMAVLLLLLAAEQKAGPRLGESAPVKFITAFGSTSMAAYFFHEMLLYLRQPFTGFSFNAVWGKQCDWPLYWLLTAVVIALTYVLVRITDRVYRRLRL